MSCIAVNFLILHYRRNNYYTARAVAAKWLNRKISTETLSDRRDLRIIMANP